MNISKQIGILIVMIAGFFSGEGKLFLSTSAKAMEKTDSSLRDGDMYIDVNLLDESESDDILDSMDGSIELNGSLNGTLFKVENGRLIPIGKIKPEADVFETRQPTCWPDS